MGTGTVRTSSWGYDGHRTRWCSKHLGGTGPARVVSSHPVRLYNTAETSGTSLSPVPPQCAGEPPGKGTPPVSSVRARGEGAREELGTGLLWLNPGQDRAPPTAA